jgi:hypothetical protein
MSSAIQSPPAAGSIPPDASEAVPPVVAEAPGQPYRVFGHSNFFFWWPVWFVGFLMAILTYVDGHVMAVVPEGTTVEQGQVVPGNHGSRDVLVVPEGQPLPAQPREGSDRQLHLRVASSNNYGVIFVATLIVVAIVTNLTVRGLASVVAIGIIIIAVLVLAQLHLWDRILHWVGDLDVRINAGGYLAIAVPIFLIWCFTVFIYDHYSYLVVTPGQVTIRQAIGDGEIAVDTTSLMLDKRRNDFFRHWLLGFGAGDLHVKTGGAANLDLELNNVLFVASKIRRIQAMIREKQVTPPTVR